MTFTGKYTPQERVRIIKKLRKEGKNFRDIGQVLGLSMNQAWMIAKGIKGMDTRRGNCLPPVTFVCPQCKKPKILLGRFIRMPNNPGGVRKYCGRPCFLAAKTLYTSKKEKRNAAARRSYAKHQPQRREYNRAWRLKKRKRVQEIIRSKLTPEQLATLKKVFS